MKMHGYVSKNGKMLYVRDSMEKAKVCFTTVEMKRMKVSVAEAIKFIEDNYNVVEIEYNEVT